VRTGEPELDRMSLVYDGIATRNGLTTSSEVTLTLIEKHKASRHLATSIVGAHLFNREWSRVGRPRFVLSHSVTALLIATKAPKIDWDYLPAPAVLLDVPTELFPLEDGWHLTGRLLIAVSRVADDGDSFADGSALLGVFDRHGKGMKWMLAKPTTERPYFVDDDKNSNAGGHTWRLCCRLAANALAYITEHRSCVRRAGAGTGIGAGTHRVSEPVDVTVTRQFRVSVASLLAARDFAGAKRAMSHLVRGHWRNQAVGEKRADRRLTWVRPHLRGDESLGRVVERIERITEAR
jgi:hypothetical protein